MTAAHHLDDSQPHAFWDNTHPPRLTIEPGDVVVFETLEGTGQIGQDSVSEALRDLDPSLVHPLTGPVFVDGAEPGDVLEIEVVDLKPKAWGWNGVIPGFGLLAEEFHDPYLHHYQVDEERCVFRDDIRIPFEPFCGVMGVAPAEPGRIDTGPPRGNAGNIDIRHLTPGSRVFVPVLVPGALFSCGDCHAAQGDGEVNGTGIETPMTVTLRFRLRRDLAPHELRFTTPADRSLSRAERGGYFVTTAHGPDLFADAQKAIRSMIDHLVDRYGLTREQAYCLCGAAVDLRINQLVNEPNHIVSAYLPLGIFA